MTTTKVTKVTKKDNFKEIQAILSEMGRTDLADAMGHEIDLLVRKAEKKPGTSKSKKERDELSPIVFDALTSLGKPSKVTEIISADYRLSGKTTQKITPVLNDLVKSGMVFKKIDKKSTVYDVVEF